MKEAQSLIRWGIPGTVFFLTFFLFILIDNFLCNIFYSYIYFSVKDANQIYYYIDNESIRLKLNDKDNIENEKVTINHHSLIRRMNMEKFFNDYSLVGLVSILITTSIPLGFIISQIYYFGYWMGIPLRTRRNIKKVLNKNEIEKFKTEINLNLPEKNNTSNDKNKIDEESLELRTLFYIGLWKKFTNFIICILNLFIKLIYNQIFKKGEISKYEYLKKPCYLKVVKDDHCNWVAFEYYCKSFAKPDEISRIDSLGDIFHGLGTSFISFTISGTLFILLHVLLPDKNINNQIIHPVDYSIYLISLAIILFIFLIFWHNRMSVLRHEIIFLKMIYNREKPKGFKIFDIY